MSMSGITIRTGLLDTMGCGARPAPAVGVGCGAAALGVLGGVGDGRGGERSSRIGVSISAWLVAASRTSGAVATWAGSGSRGRLIWAAAPQAVRNSAASIRIGRTCRIGDLLAGV